MANHEQSESLALLDVSTKHKIGYIQCFVGLKLNQSPGLDWPLCHGTGGPLRRTQAPPGPFEIF